MTTLCITSCGNQKIWSKNPNAGPTKAKNVYIGFFAKTCKEYAEYFYPGSWCILSAKHGFLFPEDIVPESYDVTFKKKSTESITSEDLKTQTKEKGIENFDKLVVLGGEDYVKIISDLFPDKAVHKPLEGCRGMGYMIGSMKKAMREGKPL